MKSAATAALALALWSGISPAQTAHVGPGTGVLNPCTGPAPGATVWQNIGNSPTWGIAWQYAGVAPPFYGAYAEGFQNTTPLPVTVTGIRIYMTQDPNQPNYQNGAFDGYLWSDAGGMPNTVLCVFPAQPASPPAFWPQVDCSDFGGCNVVLAPGGSVWGGCWANWANQPAEWFIAADTSFPGNPMTNVAPGIGYPTGWNPPSVVSWIRSGQDITSLGIGIWLQEEVTPARASSWGRIKNLYQ